MTPLIVASRKARLFAWYNRLGLVRKKLLSASRNARYIEQLLRAPQTIGSDAVASLVQTVNLVIEARCNIRCSCCHYFATRDEGGMDRSFDLARMAALLDEVPHAIVAITGGEPLMSPIRVVDTARALLRKNRTVAVVTNSLPLSDLRQGEIARGILLTGLGRSDRARVRVQCSLDIQHQVASRLSISDYASRCQAAIRHLTAAGFPVFTRSIVTSQEDYSFFREHVLPLSQSGLTLGASVQPDIYDLPRFADALRRDELGDTAIRLGQSYLRQVLNESKRDACIAANDRPVVLRTAPWVFVELNGQGVKGPSSFIAGGTHHSSILQMLRSYDWLNIADSIVPQITISQNALFYKIDRRNRSVTLNLPHIVGKLFRHRIAAGG